MKVSKIVLLITLVSLFILVKSYQFHIKDAKILDSSDRQIYFHGTNIVVKVPPYIPSTQQYDPRMSFSSDDIALLKENGFNAIRLGIMWPGLQPEKDHYNETYLQQMVKLVDKAGQSGIYTLIQFHQDILSEVYCGDGVPIWLMHLTKSYKTFPFPLDRKYPLNKTEIPDKFHCHKHPLATYYFSYDTAQSFNELYSQNSYMNIKFTKYWQKVASYFKGNKYVIAYELINEPWVGNQFRNPFLLIPSVAQRLKLQAFYDHLSSSIRTIDAYTPICFQPITFDNTIPSGFNHVPGGNHNRNLSIFCYHYYSPPELNLKAMQTNVNNGKRLIVPTLITQTYGNVQTLDQAERLKQSWIYWIYKDFGQDDKIQTHQQLHNYGNRFNNDFKSNKLSNQINSYNSSGIKHSSNIKHSSGKKNSSNSKDLTNENNLSNNQSIQYLHDRLNKQINDTWVRTYLQRVDGQLDYSNYDTKTSKFTASYWAKPNGQSILYLNKQRNYYDRYEIQAYPKENFQIIQVKTGLDRNYVKIKFNGKQKCKVLITVTKL